jgi:quercetin dioxygenase-like cupin family protein
MNGMTNSDTSTVLGRSSPDYSRIVSSVAAVEVSCPDVVAEVDHFVSLGWRIVDVFPADDPQRITIAGHGLRIVVVRGEARGSRIVVAADSGLESTSPNGTVITIEEHPGAAPRLVSTAHVSRASDRDAWHIGRAGMHYRDLVPDRQGGAVIASHIRIPEGGPVPDYPHFHEVVFQLIVCHRGWVRLAYESQGDPFVLRAGECVIQPPRIRHRVLESSDDLHVVEVGYPAEHLTIADHDFDFTTTPFDPERRWDGQRFVRFTRDEATWVATAGGATETDTGISLATADRADVRIARVSRSDSWSHGPVIDRRFTMLFVLEGRARIDRDGRPDVLDDSDALIVPVGSSVRVSGDPEATVLVVVIDTD